MKLLVTGITQKNSHQINSSNFQKKGEKMKQKRVTKLFLIVVLSSLIFLPLLSQAKKHSGSTYLVFGEYIVLSGKVNDGAQIDWAFSGSNPYVGIFVFALNQENYEIFVIDEFSAYGYQLSNGDYYADYGTFSARSKGNWYIVMWNFDPTLESTLVTYEVTFPGNVGMIIGIIIGALVVIGIIGAVVSSLRKKKTPETGYQPIQPTAPAQPTFEQEQVPTQPVEQEFQGKFCTTCGAALEGKFCTQCGAQN
jgi:hypothetical protein